MQAELWNFNEQWRAGSLYFILVLQGEGVEWSGILFLIKYTQTLHSFLILP